MMSEKICSQVLEHIDAVLNEDTPQGKHLWHDFINLHHADIAKFLGDVDRDSTQRIFLKIPDQLKLEIFSHFSYSMKFFCLSFLDDHDRSHLLNSLPLDELTDFFDELSDEELKTYLKLLHTQDREKVLALMQFNPESAGGMMDTNVLTLMQDFTVEKSLQILQRLQPKQELHHQIYVTNQDNQLVGHINLEDLVMKKPQTRLSSILRETELIAPAHEDRETIAHQMVHYKLTTVPVVGDNNVFLGIIPSETLVEIIEQEAAEDVYKISALAPIKNTYFETSFFSLFYQRSSILVALLLLQTFSTLIIQYYEAILCGFFARFTTMLIGTGGNSSSQTSALVIQGIMSGEVNPQTARRFLMREFLMALSVASVLGVVSFIRIQLTQSKDLTSNLIVSFSLGIIVLVATMLGGIIPLLLKKLRLDPALSAGPFLATIMDVLGLLIYCFIAQRFMVL